MVMTVGNMLLALGMFISGTTNTITAKWATRTSSDGNMGPTTIWGDLDGDAGKGVNHSFDHPFFQAAIMFLGEALCLVVYLIKKRMQDPERVPLHNPNPKPPYNIVWYFALPATLDMLGTGVMNAGLCLTTASVFQMLRSASVVFCALLSVFVLKRKLMMYHWFAIFLVVLGVFVVGFISVQNAGDTGKSTSTLMTGNVLVIVAQFMVACQMVVEESIIGKYGAPALKAVGCEGIFGFIILSVLLVPLYYINVSGGAKSYPIEDAMDAFKQVGNSGELQVSICLYLCSIAFFNFFGISVTKAMSASHRMVLDSLRTCAVLTISVALGWEEFLPLQLVGFAILLLGTGIYNEIIRLPFLFTYPDPDDNEKPRESFVESVRQDSTDTGRRSEKDRRMNEPLLANV